MNAANTSTIPATTMAVSVGMAAPIFYDLKKLRPAAISALTWIKALSVTMELTGPAHVNILL
jgi:hypothetical protein